MSASEIDTILSGGGGRKSHHDLQAWRASVDLATTVYALIEGFPDSDRYGRTSQIRRAVMSVAADLAEGSSRSSSRESLRYVWVARSSLVELETLMIIAHCVEVVSQDEIAALSRRMNSALALLSGLICWLRKRTTKAREANHLQRDG